MSVLQVMHRQRCREGFSSLNTMILRKLILNLKKILHQFCNLYTNSFQFNSGIRGENCFKCALTSLVATGGGLCLFLG